MTDAEKIADYDRVVQIIEGQLALEKHMRAGNKDGDQISFTRVDAYEHIVQVIKGPILH